MANDLAGFFSQESYSREGLFHFLMELRCGTPKYLEFNNAIQEVLPLLTSKQVSDLNYCLAFMSQESTNLDLSLFLQRTAISPQQAKIILIGCNPAIDLVLQNGQFFAGGSIGTIGSVLASFQVPTIHLGFVSCGESGQLFKSLCKQRGIETAHMTEIGGETGFTVYTLPNQRIPRGSPVISTKERVRFLKNFQRVIEESNPEDPPLIIFSGSVTDFEGYDSTDLIPELIGKIRETQGSWDKKSKIWLDAKSEVLMKSAICRPDYLKINIGEFSSIFEHVFGQVINPAEDIEAISKKAKRLSVKLSIPLITVTLGAKGAVQVSIESNEALYVKPTKVLRNCYTVGLGDTMMAVQAIGHVENSNRMVSLEYGVAASMVTAKKPGGAMLANIAEIDSTIKQLRREKIRFVNITKPTVSYSQIVASIHRGLGVDPVLVADMDDTLTPFGRESSTEMIDLIIESVRKTKFVVLTSSSLERVNTQIWNKLYTRVPETDRGILQNFTVFAAQGSQAYAYDEKSSKLKQIFLMPLADIISETQLSKLEDYIRKLALSDSHLPVPKGDVIDNRQSQLTFMVLGKDASPSDKEEFDRNSGRETRERLAGRINKFLEANGIKAYCRLGGKSSIDITAAGIDKGYGIERVVETLNIELSQIIFFGDELWRGGIDYPAAEKALVTINVGPTPKNVPSGTYFINSQKFGPEGALEDLKAILVAI